MYYVTLLEVRSLTLFLLEAPTVPCLSQRLEAACTPWSVALFSLPGEQSYYSDLCSNNHISFSGSNTLPPFYRDPYD